MRFYVAIGILMKPSEKYLNSLSKCDKEFYSKYTQLLKETKQRFQKEFDEL